MNPRKKQPRMNKFQRANDRRERLARALHGEGLYVYKNNTKGTLILPKPTHSGKTNISEGAEFEGDNYYMGLVQSNSLRLVRELISPEQERQQKMLNEEKLILDQPSTVTVEGTVEHVKAPVPKATKKPVENITEALPQNKNDVLLTEDPLEGVTILG